MLVPMLYFMVTTVSLCFLNHLTGDVSYKNNESHERKERAGGEKFQRRHLGGVEK
jgi:hypothetical protein